MTLLKVMLNEQNQIYDMVNMTSTMSSGLNNSMSSKLQQQSKALSSSSIICSSLAQLLSHLFSSVNGLIEQDDLAWLASAMSAADTGVKFKVNLVSRATDFVR